MVFTYTRMDMGILFGGEARLFGGEAPPVDETLTYHTIKILHNYCQECAVAEKLIYCTQLIYTAQKN